MTSCLRNYWSAGGEYNSMTAAGGVSLLAFVSFICMTLACVHVHTKLWFCSNGHMSLCSWKVCLNAWPVHAHRTACNNTDCQSEEEQKEETVVERRSSLSELGSKLTSLILPLKTLVQLNAHRYHTVALLSANKPRDWHMVKELIIWLYSGSSSCNLNVLWYQSS